MSMALPYGREVHNHGVEEGRGLYCRERIAVDGYPIGECIVGTAECDTPKEVDTSTKFVVY